MQWERIRKLTQDAMDAMIRHVTAVDDGVWKLRADLNALHDALRPTERIWGGNP